MKPPWPSLRRHVVVLAVLLCGMPAWPGFGAGPGAPQGFLRTNDVIALIGGEDVVAMQQNGYLELLLTAALPHHQLRFRSLAFEGDTVFEQHRQLNWPSWEKQLERVGATVVMAQFGQAESLRGTNGLGRFVEAYSRLLQRLTNGGRRLVLMSPTPFESTPGAGPDLQVHNTTLEQYAHAAGSLATSPISRFVSLLHLRPGGSVRPVALTRDGLHLNEHGHWLLAQSFATSFALSAPAPVSFYIPIEGTIADPKGERLRQLILEKNRLWFDYWRPQNWAFLHGDRVEQASSRDHRDPKKRWFPEEMEKFLPLIEAEEREIWKLAAEIDPRKP